MSDLGWKQTTIYHPNSEKLPLLPHLFKYLPLLSKIQKLSQISYRFEFQIASLINNIASNFYKERRG